MIINKCHCYNSNLNSSFYSSLTFFPYHKKLFYSHFILSHYTPICTISLLLLSWLMHAHTHWHSHVRTLLHSRTDAHTHTYTHRRTPLTHTQTHTPTLNLPPLPHAQTYLTMISLDPFSYYSPRTPSQQLQVLKLMCRPTDRKNHLLLRCISQPVDWYPDNLWKEENR